MGNNSWTHFPFFSRHLVAQNVGNIIVVCFFSILGRSRTENPCSPHFSKQSIPGLFYLKPHRKVSATELELFTTNFKNLKKTDQPVFKPCFVCQIWVSNNPGFVPGSPPGGFTFPEMTPQKHIFSGNIGYPSKNVIC